MNPLLADDELRRLLAARRRPFRTAIVAAWAVGARKGFIYLRGEYRYLLEPLREALDLRRAENLLGCGIQGVAGFDIGGAGRVGSP